MAARHGGVAATAACWSCGGGRAWVERGGAVGRTSAEDTGTKERRAARARTSSGRSRPAHWSNNDGRVLELRWRPRMGRARRKWAWRSGKPHEHIRAVGRAWWSSALSRGVERAVHRNRERETRGRRKKGSETDMRAPLVICPNHLNSVLQSNKKTFDEPNPLTKQELGSTHP